MARLSWMQRGSYSVGHVLNDLCAACWFSYLLLYLQQVQGLSGTQSGIVLFSGQIADAIATPLAGLGSDATLAGLPALGLGRRKVWNFGGVLIVALSFYFIFGVCLACELTPSGSPGPSQAVKTATFAVAASLFNVGWAAVQVSHMALVPELSVDEGERVLLNSARYFMTVLSNVTVFLAFLGLLAAAGGEAAMYSPHVYSQLAWAVLGLGGACSIVFLVGVVEPTVSANGSAYVSLMSEGPTGGLGYSSDEHVEGVTPQKGSLSIGLPSGAGAVADVHEGSPLTADRTLRATGGSDTAPSPRLELGGARRKSKMTWKDWLITWPFYQVASVYATIRLAVNVSQVYLSFYITETLDMRAEALAAVPLVCYIAQLGTTLMMKAMSSRLGRRRALTVGALAAGSGCALFLVLTPTSAGGVYPAALLLGVGCAACMVISVSMEGDLVGPNTESGAFVFGSISCGDKLFSGIVVLAIQSLADQYAPTGSAARPGFIRVVTGLVPLVGLMAGMVVSWTIRFPKALQGKHAHSEGSIVATALRAVRHRDPPGTTIRRGVSYYGAGMGGAGSAGAGLTRNISELDMAVLTVAADRDRQRESLPFYTSGQK